MATVLTTASAGTSRVASKLLGTLLTQVFTWGVAFLVNIFVPGYLSASQFATLVLVGTISGGVVMLLGMGMSQLLVREVAREPQRLAEFFWAALALRGPLVLLGVGVGTLLSLALGYDADLIRLIVASLVLMVFSQVNAIATALLQGMGNFGRGNIAQAVERTLSAVVQIALVWTRQPLWTFVLLPAVGTVVALCINMAVLWPQVRLVQRAESGTPWRVDTLRFLVRSGLPLMAGYLLFAIWDPCIQILLSKIASADAGGWYALTRRFIGSALFVPAALASVTLPVLSRAYQEDVSVFCDVVRQNVRVTLLCVAPIASLFLFASEPMMRLLHYLPKYAGALPVFQIFGAALILWFLSQMVGNALVASDRQGALGRFTVVAALLVPVLGAPSIYLADRYLRNGAVGAAVADIVIEMFLLINYLRLLPRDGRPVFEPAILARIVLAVVPASILFAMVREPHRLWLVPVGILCYLVCCWRFGAITSAEMRPFLQRFLRRT